MNKHLLPALWILFLAARAEAQQPFWIWHSQAGEELCARRKFPVHNRVRSAELRICADDGATIYLNGRKILDPVSGRKVQKLNVTSRLRLGRNVLAAKIKRQQGERGFVALLVITLSTGRQLLVNSDAMWKAAAAETKGWTDLAFDDSRWPQAKPLAVHGAKPWGSILGR